LPYRRDQHIDGRAAHATDEGNHSASRTVAIVARWNKITGIIVPLDLIQMVDDCRIPIQLLGAPITGESYPVGFLEENNSMLEHPASALS
jgi:hypothetical protein